MARAWPIATVLAAAVFAALSLSPADSRIVGGAEAAAPARPVILSLSVTPTHGRPLRAAGDAVVIAVHVRNATRCTFLAQHSSSSSLYPLKTVACTSGHATVTVRPIANLSTSRVELTYAVRVQGSGATPVQRRIALAQSAARATPPAATPAAAPPTATLSISSVGVPATGGVIGLTYSSTNASSCSLSSTPALVAGSDPQAVTCSGTTAVTVPASSTAQQWIITFTAANAAGQSASSTVTLTQQAPPPPPPTFWAQSTNWSGYVIPSNGPPVTEVSGQWIVPALNCTATPNAGASAWVGIGGSVLPSGVGSGDLLQTGVRTDCVGGMQQNVGWFEKVPSDPDVEQDFAGFPVTAGDSIQAWAFQDASGAWETRLDDLTTGLSGWLITGQGWGVSPDGGNNTFPVQGSAASLSYSGGYTAEWVVEAYTADSAVVTLADYGTVTFTNLTTSLSPWSLTTSSGLELVQGGVVVSAPSLPSGDGFSVTYTG